MYNPSSLEEFIGQEGVINQIKIVMKAAKKTNKLLPHMIFYGGPGLGKTALGKVVASEMGSDMTYCIGNNFEPIKELIRLQKKTILFVDEIHRLRPAVEELLYEPLDSFELSSTTGIYNMPLYLSPFTFIGATTLLGKVSKPLRDRCMLNLHFKPYSIDVLVDIIAQACYQKGILIRKPAAIKVANMARGIPRIALKITEMCNNVLIANGDRSAITRETVIETASLLAIGFDGLSEDDIGYLDLLFNANRPIGQTAVSKTLGVDIKTVTDVIEPFLIENGYVILGDTGRVLTQKGLNKVIKQKGEGDEDGKKDCG